MNELTDVTDPTQTNCAYTPAQSATITDWMEREVAEYDVVLDEPPAVILDIGANIGAFSLRCAKRWPDAKIFAYEPGRDNADGYRTNCADLKNAVFKQSAVRRFNGQDLLLRGEKPVVHSFHQLGRQSREGGYYVDCVSAAELPDADLIKIDTEGCEVEILEKLKTDRAKAIVCEYHRAEDRAAILELCHQRGFKVREEIESPHKKGFGLLKFTRLKAQKETKLFIGLPVYQQMCTQFSLCLMALQKEKPCEIDLKVGQGDGVMRTRNVLTHDFLNGDCTHMLMIDCDLIFAPYHIKRIISHDVDVVGGLYPKKQEGPLEWVINTWPGPVEKRADGLHKVAYIGTGFICVKRHVFEKMAKKYSQIAFGADYGSRDVMHEFWPMGVYCYECRAHAGPNCTHSPKHRRYLSEDWYFCQRWMDMGGEIFADTGVPLKHIGPAIFPLATQLSEVASPKPPADSLPSSDSAVQQTAMANEQA